VEDEMDDDVDAEEVAPYAEDAYDDFQSAPMQRPPPARVPAAAAAAARAPVAMPCSAPRIFFSGFPSRSPPAVEVGRNKVHVVLSIHTCLQQCRVLTDHSDSART
jgi:hypothetical protein